MAQLADHDHTKLFICGRGPLLDELINLIHELRLDNCVTLLGFRNDVRELCYATDTFVFPSVQEGLSMAMMEALASGLPVIASDIRGNRELVDEGMNGIFCSPHIPEDYAMAIAEIQMMDMALLSKNSLDIIQKYDVEYITEKMRQVYENVIQNK